MPTSSAPLNPRLSLILLSSIALLPASLLAQSTWNTSAGSTNWATAGNWTPSGVPISSTAVTLSATSGNMPTVSAAGAVATSVTVNGNANTRLTVSGSGVLTVSGTTQTTTTIGSTTTGNLTVSSGGTLNSVASVLGSGTAGQGFATVTGTGSQWISTGNLTVGSSGRGTLLVEAGGKVGSATGTIGSSLNASGGSFATVTGAGSQWTMTGSFSVANSGSGTLLVSDGGKVSSTGAGTISSNTTPTTAIATVTGAGSTWSSGAAINVGGIGTGNLVVNSGGVVSSTLAVIGNNNNGIGIVTISGAGSAWNNSGSAIIGNNGQGTVTLTDGGTLKAGGGTGTVIIANTASGVGVLNIGAAAGNAATAGGIVSAATITKGLGSGGGLQLNTTGTSAAPYYLSRDGTSSGGAIALSGSLNVTNTAGYTVLTGANTNTGVTTINGGTIQFGDGAAGSGGFAGNIVNNTANTLFFNPGSTATGTGIISGAGGLTKNGSGTLTLSGVSTYTGITTINGGVLGAAVLGDGGTDSSIGRTSAAASNLILNGGNLRYTGTGGSTNRQVTVSTSGGGLEASGGAAFTYNGALTLAGTDTARTFTVGGSGIGTLTAVIADNGVGATSLTKTGSGTFSLTAANTYTGVTTINGGSLGIFADNNLGPAPASPTAGSLSMGGGRVLANNTLTLDANRGITLVSGTSGLSAAPGATLTYAGAITGTGNLSYGTTTTGTGTILLNGTDTHTGTTTITGGATVRAGATNVLSSSSALTVANSAGSTLDLAGYDQTIGSLAGGSVSAGHITLGSAVLTTGGNNTSTTYTGIISGTGGLTKNGSGTFTLASANTYDGATTVSAGTLRVNGSLGATTVNVLTAATLGGTGTIGGATTVAGTLSPGITIGTLTFGSNLTLLGTSTSAFTLNSLASFDRVVVGGEWTPGGTLSVTLGNGFDLVEGQSFDLFDFVTAGPGAFAGFALPDLADGLAWDQSALYTTGTLSVTSAVPEPATFAALAGLATLGLAVTRRRRAA